MDRDLESMQQARHLCVRAREAQLKFKEFSQKDVDRVVAAMADAGFRAAEQLAQLAVEETGFGVVADKVAKNQLATRDVYNLIKNMKTVGVINELPGKRILEIAEPMGVIAGIVPVTNPTSTVLFKSLIAVKARNAIVFSPHPNAVRCANAAAAVMSQAAESAGAPPGLISCMTLSTLQGTNELMHHRDVAIILATGGAGLVKAAYSAGKPAYGVGPGNVPAFIERTADVRKAVADIAASKTFDNGTVCASEQAIIADLPIKDQVIAELQARKAYFLNPDECRRVGATLVTRELTVSPDCVGQPAYVIAQKAGIAVPRDTSMLVAPLDGVGPHYPLSIEKLSPVIAFYVADGWEAGCERCIEILNFGGLGHTLVIHSRDEEVIMQFALKKPAFRILVNTPGTHGAVGITTELDPSMMLGCGTYGGNITTDNVTPMHLLNIKRVAYETKPLRRSERSTDWRPELLTHGRVNVRAPYQAALTPAAGISRREAPQAEFHARQPSPAPRGRYGSSGLTDEEVERIVAEFLQTR
ncbi:MAG: aldehyde dehydrogenase family protein [bacterium]|nr:aldehyde dehydrogenase family protein [candidate division KSB1 bacterium]MDH7561598.1 aldehyde dehydrogenase family protein [bacterium]